MTSTLAMHWAQSCYRLTHRPTSRPHNPIERIEQIAQTMSDDELRQLATGHPRIDPELESTFFQHGDRPRWRR